MSALDKLIELAQEAGEHTLVREAAAELAARDKALEVVSEALKATQWDVDFPDDDAHEEIRVYCSYCYVLRDEIQNGADKHADGCKVAAALAALEEVEK